MLHYALWTVALGGALYAGIQAVDIWLRRREAKRKRLDSIMGRSNEFLTYKTTTRSWSAPAAKGFTRKQS